MLKEKDLNQYIQDENILDFDACAFCSFGTGSIRCKDCVSQKRYRDLSSEDKRDLSQTVYASANRNK